MKDDKIKKCLIAGYDMDIISQEELNEYWNYITNLQEENESLHIRIKTIKRRRKAQTAKMRKYREEINNKQNNIVNYKSRIEKALDKLYCYGEIFDSKILQQFQKEMENILQGSDKDE